VSFSLTRVTVEIVLLMPTISLPLDRTMTDSLRFFRVRRW
jgi:hypothetical protein